MSSSIKLALSTHFLFDSIPSLSGFLELVRSVIKEGDRRRSWTGATPLFYRFCTVFQEADIRKMAGNQTHNLLCSEVTHPTTVTSLL